MIPKNILVVEDDAELAELICFNLEACGYRVVVTRDGQSGLDAAVRRQPDLILLDIMLPGLLGTDICRSLRKNKKLSSIPIIFISARTDEVDRVVGFELGADDYVVKPFSVRELLLRVQAVLRRGNSASVGGKTISNGKLVLDPERCDVSWEGRNLPLTAIEFKLLLTLMEHTGTVQNRDTLLKRVWGYGYSGDSRTVDTHITRLRAKLGNEAGSLIKTVRGFGYTMEYPKES